MTFDDRMQQARAAEDAGDADAAYARYDEAIRLDGRRPEAWLGRARAAGARAPWRSLPVAEIRGDIGRAIEQAPRGGAEAVRARGAALLRDMAIAHYERSARHLADYVSARGEWREHLGRCATVLRALEAAHALDPTDPVPLEKTIEVCAAQIEGVVYDDIGDYQIVTQRRHGITPASEAELRARRARCGAALARLRPGYVLPPLRKRELDRKGSCFVVTATLGDPDHPDAVTLRRWRDERLARTRHGPLLVAAYARVGPRAAELIRRVPLLRAVSRSLLVAPLASAVRRLEARAQGRSAR